MNIPKRYNPRLVTGVTILIVLGLALYFNSWLLFTVLLLTSLIAQYEFYKMFWPGRTEMLFEKICGLLLGCSLITAAFLNADTATMLFVIVAGGLGALSFLARYGLNKTDASFPQSMLMLAGITYIPLLLQMTFQLSSSEILLIVVAVTSSDAVAYYVGSAWGKRKIWPGVSPKKSVLGSVGSLIACILVVMLTGMLLWGGAWYCWMVVGIIINIMAQLGDFFESALKRSINVKDSGSILPGHGGILDRIDSFLFALPTYVLLKFLIL